MGENGWAAVAEDQDQRDIELGAWIGNQRSWGHNAGPVRVAQLPEIGMRRTWMATATHTTTRITWTIRPGDSLSGSPLCADEAQ